MPPKRIPSSFTSKAITEGEYIAGASGSKLSATKLPVSMSAPAGASTSKAGRSTSHANASKSKVAKVRSDEPTVLLGVVDMPVPKAPAKGGKGGTSIARVDSAAPTALVAPADYVHMYKAGGVKVVAGGGTKNKGAGKGGGDALTAVSSEAPTALIAPNDYEHIFCAPEANTKKVGKVVSKAPVTSEVHAPASKMQKSKVANKKDTAAAGGGSSSATKLQHQQPPQQTQHSRHANNNSKSKGNRKKETSKPTSATEKAAAESATPGDGAPGDQDDSGCCLIM
ncbi:hypothetical protein TYRP_008175 [Tyrophagus putrescentiae]|nr:hypothetical protein TYRP_008175 [Tyrophagus putrescentiae]